MAIASVGKLTKKSKNYSSRDTFIGDYAEQMLVGSQVESSIQIGALRNLQTRCNIFSKFLNIGSEVRRSNIRREDTIVESAGKVSFGISRSQNEAENLLFAGLSKGFFAHIIFAQGLQVPRQTSEVGLVNQLSDAINPVGRCRLDKGFPFNLKGKFQTDGLADFTHVRHSVLVTILDVFSSGNWNSRVARAGDRKIFSHFVRATAEVRFAGSHHQGSIIISGAAVVSRVSFLVVIQLKGDFLRCTERLNKGLFLNRVLAERYDLFGESTKVPSIM